MTDENMKIWNAMAQPPISALKKISGGRLSGMSNISPQWRWKIMTETFGMVGFGWKYTVEKIWTSPGAGDSHFAFASINLYVKMNGEWSEAIPGEGGSMLIEKERNGMHNNDEAFKMAVTDALGTAMAKLGVAADVYLGSFDGSKYRNEASQEKPPTPHANFPKKADTPEQVKALVKSNKSEGWTKGEILSNKHKQMDDLIQLTGASPVEIAKYLATLDANQKFTLLDIENGMANAKADAQAKAAMNSMSE